MTEEKGKTEYEKFCTLAEEGKATESLKWLDKACELKYADALIAKAKIIGFDDELSLNKYRELVEEACSQGSGEAWAMKGDLYSRLPVGGEEIFALEDGISYENKEKFVSKLPTLRKFDCYEKAAELGYRSANVFLGETLLKPEFAFIAERDAQKEAFGYFKRGADGGDEKCVLRLAECLEEGCGTDKDVPKAVSIYKELVGRGNKDAMLHLSEIYSVGREGIEPDRETAMKYMLMTGLKF